MCNYKTIHLEKNILCIPEKILQKSLPEDENELCIFHSQNLRWKYDNDFNTHLMDLLNHLNKSKEGVIIQLFGLHIPFFDNDSKNSSDSQDVLSLLKKKISLKD